MRTDQKRALQENKRLARISRSDISELVGGSVNGKTRKGRER